VVAAAVVGVQVCVDDDVDAGEIGCSPSPRSDLRM
jgi:hypothetical protein